MNSKEAGKINRPKRRIHLVLCVFIAAFSIGYHRARALAQDTTIIPSVAVGGAYDSNIRFTENNEIDDYLVTASPALELGYNTERLKLALLGRLDFLFYTEETDFDTIDQDYRFDGRFDISNRWSLLGNLRYQHDETIRSQLEETGRVFNRTSRKWFEAGGGFRYVLSELSEIGPDFTFRNVKYGSSRNEDYKLYDVELPYQRLFRNQRDTVILTPGYSHLDTDPNESDDIRLTLGWKHLYSETVTSEIRLGGRYTRIDSKESDEDDNKPGGIAAFNLYKNGETFRGMIGLSHDLKVDTEARLIQLTRLYLRGDQRVVERFGVRLTGIGNYTKNEFGDEKKVSYFEVRPSAYVLLTENHTLELIYSYQNQIQWDEPNNPTSTRNRIWLGFNFAFPQEWY